MLNTNLQGAHLSSQQMRLWTFLGESQAYRSACALLLRGSLQENLLERSLACLLETNEILRTTFRPLGGMDRPLQVVARSVDIDFHHISLELLSEQQQWDQVDTLYADVLAEPFDLARDFPLRVSLLGLDSSTSVLLICLPAMCADARTLSLLVRELGRIYAAYSQQEVPELDPLQYIDVSAWQNDLLQDEDAEQHQAYWHNIDLQPLYSYRLPLTRQSVCQVEPAGPFASGQTKISLEKYVMNSLHTYLQQHHVSLEAFLLACWHILLWRLTTLTAPTGVVCNGRYYEELSEAPGFYSRIVPFALNLEDNRPFEQIAIAVEQLLQSICEEQSYFDWKRCWPDPARSLSYFPVLFEYEQWSDCQSLANLSCSLYHTYTCNEPFMLKLSAIDKETDLDLCLYYNSALLTSEQSQQLLSYLHTLLVNVLLEPQKSVGQLPVLSTSELQRLVAGATGEPISFPQSPVQSLFESQVERTPELIAVICEETQLTYEQLNVQANQLAHYLRAQGVGPDVLVGLLMERSVFMLIAVLGILKAGGAYVPLDPEAPVSRLYYQLQDIWSEQSTRILLTQSTILPALEVDPAHIFCLDTAADLLAQQESANPSLINTATDRAYVIYTSGSTGTPKGVEICHRSLVNYTWSMCQRIAPESGRQFATVSTLAADLGNTMIFCSLLSGGTLHVLTYDMVLSGDAFARYTTRHLIDILKIVPSHFQTLLATCSEQPQNLLPRAFLLLGGEALSQRLLEEIAGLGGTCHVMNHYGPTETTIGVLVNDLGVLTLEQLQAQREPVVSPGRPIANTQVLILDRYQQIVPEGVPGELVVGGECLARGYLHQPVQTQERFFTFSTPGLPEMRLYRTGDLGYIELEHHQVMFLGRADNQVKLRGYRIELTEIEIMLLKHPDVRECTVILDQTSASEPFLVACLVPRVQDQDIHEAVLTFLREHLPAYMVPAYWFTLPMLPLTRNGKVDRQQLLRDWQVEYSQGFTNQRARESRQMSHPRDELEFRLLGIWESIVSTRPIGIFDNFFDIGGSSLSAVRLVSLIKKELAFDITLAMLFRAPTIAELAVLIRQQQPGQRDSAIIPLQPQGTRTPFFCIHPVGGTVFRYRHLARHMAPDQPFYGLQAPELDDDTPVLHSMAELVDYYISVIQQVQPQGPYCLGGWSLGGVIAFAMARRLQALGQSVALLALLDSTVPSAFFTHKPAREIENFTDADVAKWLIGEKFIAASEQDLNLIPSEELLFFVWQQAKKEQVILADIDFTRFRNVAYVTQRNLHLIRSYVPQVYAGKITLLRCSSSVLSAEDAHDLTAPDDVMTLAKVSRTGGWEQLTTDEVEVHMVQGNHSNLVDEPYVQELAEILNQCLSRAQNAPQR